MATMASKGSLKPSKLVVIVLGVLMGGIACAMLLVGGLVALQQAAVLGSVPFAIVLVGRGLLLAQGAARRASRGRDGARRSRPRAPVGPVGRAERR